MPGARWMIVIAELYQLEKVIGQIAVAGFEYFFPRVRKTVRHRGKRISREFPLLYNYLPVKLCGDANESKVINMRGVAQLIGPACPVEIDRIKSRCGADGVMITPKEEKFKRGQLVQTKQGALIGLVGEFAGARHDKDIALFNILGAKRPVEFKEGELVSV